MTYLDTHDQNCAIIAAAVLAGELDVSGHTQEKTCPDCGTVHIPTHGGELRCVKCYYHAHRGSEQWRHRKENSHA